VFYMMHDMIVKALLFLLAGSMIYLTKSERMDEMSGLIRNYPALGWMFFIVVLSLTGIPPLSGFLGKVLLGQGAIAAGSYVLLGLSFASGFIVLYSLLRIFMSCFWGETIISEEEEIPLRKGVLFPMSLLVCCTFLLGLGSEAVAVYIVAAAETLMNPSIYIDAVLYNHQLGGDTMAAQFLLNLFIALLWVLLKDEDVLRWQTIVVGFIVGSVIIYMMRRFFGGRFYLHRFLSIIKLILIFISETIQSTIVVIKHIITPK